MGTPSEADAIVSTPQASFGANRLELLDTLSRIGKRCQEYVTPDGGRLLLLEYGGRVLGVFPKESDENFYWTHPALVSPDSARTFYRSAEWHNSGGDRTWVSPEVDVFFPNFPHTDVWSVPDQLDPGSYSTIKTERGPELANRCNITLSRSREEVEVEITKSWAPAPNPLRHEGLLKEGLAHVEFAGYEQRTSLRVLKQAGSACAEVGLWNLTQLPPGGETLIPIYFPSQPKVYFGRVTSEDVAVSDHLVRFRVHGQGSKKIGIQTAAATGRIAYIYEARSRCSLIIRNFCVNPSAEYADVPWEDDGSTGDPVYPVQACYVNSELGQFAELEYHAPAIGLVGESSQCRDTSQVWAFRGSSDQIRLIMKRLVTSEG